ncbi:MAG: ABC transporter substrate-binding protein [Oscillospiraceae bacterium]|nr:ABC transporter substrate-binding protein [Oscillospiraceae bacterium]
MLKKISCMLLIAILAIAIVACDDAGTPEGQIQNGDSPQSDVVLSYIIDRDTDLTGLVAVMEAFTAETGIRFEQELRPGGAEGETFLQVRFATGEASDFIWFNSGSMVQLLDPTNNLADLTGQPFLDRLQSSFLETVTFDGRVVGIPGRTSMGGGWLYNIAVYEELGLEIPTTWDELVANNEIILASGRTPVIASYRDSWTAQLLLLADFHNLQIQVPNFAEQYSINQAHFATTPAALRGFERLADIFERGFINADHMAVTHDMALEMLVSGEGVHYPMLTFALDSIYATFGEEAANNIGIFAQPADSAEHTGLTVWMPDGWFANQNSPNLEYVMQFFDFFLSEQGQAVLISVARGVGPSVVIGAPAADNAFTAVRQMQERYFDTGRNAPALEFITPVTGPNLPQICVAVGTGTMTPLEGAQEYDNDVRNQALQLELPGWD